MRAASSPLEHAGRGARLPELELRPEVMLVLANALSLLRGVAALSILLMSLAGASAVAVLAVAVPMWLTDALDGWVARRAWRRGAGRRLDGAALDPLMDDIAFTCGFLILLVAGVAPLWFVALLLVTRILFALVRMLRLTEDEPVYALPLFVTKINGVVLALGQLLLLTHLAFPATLAGSDAFVAVVIAIMSATTTCSVARFAIRRHGRALGRLLLP